MTQDEFVTAVMRTQEQVNLDDFWPTDDIYKMVLHNANMCLEDLQATYQWSWLRKRLVLGHTRRLGPHDHNIPEYELPKWVNRVSTLYQDRLLLCPYHKTHPDPRRDDPQLVDIINTEMIGVPFSSKGAIHVNDVDVFNRVNVYPQYEPELKAVIVGRTVTFNRLLNQAERNRAAVVDVQIEIPRFHICNEHCRAHKYKDADGNWTDIISYDPNNYHPCKQIPKSVLDFMPDKDYVIIQTAALNAEGSEIAKDKQMNLQNRADKRLSVMKESDVGATDVDQLEYEPFEFLTV